MLPLLLRMEFWQHCIYSKGGYLPPFQTDAKKWMLNLSSLQCWSLTAHILYRPLNFHLKCSNEPNIKWPWNLLHREAALPLDMGTRNQALTLPCAAEGLSLVLGPTYSPLWATRPQDLGDGSPGNCAIPSIPQGHKTLKFSTQIALSPSQGLLGPFLQVHLPEGWSWLPRGTPLRDVGSYWQVVRMTIKTMICILECFANDRMLS